MSNNNHPHGHLSQAAQNPSWNPLQIPSYIPRQPQLAHMSNERPMVRSPLAWHASAQPPPPPDAIYNFMSANHKNLDHHHQMNPLLAPPYTGTLPFDSMDLSLQSSRSAAPTLNKPGQQQQQQQQAQQQQQQSHLHAPPNYPTIHNLTTNTAGAGSQQGHLTGMPASVSPASAASKYLNANGAGPADCESLLPPPPSTPPNNNNNNHNSSAGGGAGNGNSSNTGSTNNSNNNVPPTPHYMQNRDENFKLTQLKSIQKATELSGKECGYGAGAVGGAAGKLAAHNMQQQHAKKPSPLRNYHQQQQQQQHQQPYNMKYNGPQTPPTPQSPLDYNQLHLHHQLHANVGSYAPQPQQQQQQQHMQQEQQQHQQQQQHLHYAPPTHPHHNQHLAPPPPPHMTSAQFQQQQQQQQQHQQQPHHQQQQQPQQTHTPQMHSRNTQLTNLDMSKHKSQEPQSQEDEAQTIITDLSTNATYRSNNAPTGATPMPEDKQLAEAPESPYMTTSNEESLESNSNSSNSRKRRKRKASQVMRLTPNENVKRQRTPSPHGHSNSCSPKQSPKNGGGDVSGFQAFGLQKEQPKPMENGRAISPPTAAGTENSNSSTLYNDTDNPKTKKQRQALLQRNLTEQQRRQHDSEDSLPAAKEATATATIEAKMPPPSPQSNSSSSSSSSSSAGTHSSHSSRPVSETPQVKEQPQEQQEQQLADNKAMTDTPASPALVEQGNIDAKPAVSVHDDEDEVEEITPAAVDKQPLPATTSPPAATAASETPTNATATAASASEPCHFNEVEDKLEEMFAGIEDEPANESESRASETGPDLSSQLMVTGGAQEKPMATSTPPATPELRPMATKAAMKSTVPSPRHSPPPTTEVPVKELAPSPAPPVAKVLPRTPPTRCMPPRRLSMGMDPSLLRFTIEEQLPKPKKTMARNKKQAEIEQVVLDSDDDDKPSTSAAAAAALAARKLSEAAAAVKTVSPKANNKNAKKKKATAAKNKKTTGKNAAKQNGKKGVRKPFSTDEDSTPAPIREGGAAVDLRFKSPFILIKPDGSISIKNTHSAEDVNEKLTKKKQTKASHERKNLRGMHSSTLSNRYDADTTDSSWICVFCKRGPHKLGLGDLFGPYLVSIDCEEYRAALQVPSPGAAAGTAAQDIDGLFVSKRKRTDMVKLQPRNLPVVPATLANIMQAPKITMHKRKRKQTQESSHSYSDDQNESQCSSQDPLDCTHETKFVETFRGMSKTSDLCYEIWLHEDCAVWANDIQLIGAHVNGLDAAVWDSTRYQCVYCAQPGASICCFHRACKAAAHVPCARSANWSLSEEDRKVFCQLHTPEDEDEDEDEDVNDEETKPLGAGTGILAIEPQVMSVPVPININSLP